MEYNEQKQERVILAGVHRGMRDALWDTTEESIHELGELVKTAGGIVVGEMIQNKADLESATYMGEGKLDELKIAIETLNADMVVFDDELSPVQMRNISDFLEIKVLDRSMLILDIFAMRAKSGEGKLQVELAQLKYQLPRLRGMGAVMSRTGGGIGTRGPGETKLESDRRHIRRRISALEEELRELEKHRNLLRSRRKKDGVITAALVGYTNAGKSTLLNALTHSDVLEEDMLFATLDPTTRSYELENGQKILFTDTVGFIRKLPHHLIEAFKSTLEEAKYADYILHVVDASNPQRDKQMHIVYDTLYQLDIRKKTIITLFNKQDQVTDEEPIRDFKADYTLAVSAKKGTGLEELKELFCTLLRDNKILVERTISYQEAGILQQIRKSGELLEEEYRPEGIFIRAYVTPEIYGSL